MKTADLIAALASEAAPTPPAPVTRPILAACAAGAAATLVLLVLWLGLRPLADALASRPFWMKAGYTAVLGLAGVLMVRRLARPGGRVGWAPLIALAALAALAGLSGLEMVHARPDQTHALMMGHTARVCSLRILALSAPIYLAAVWVLRRLAPTRLALTGAAAGLLAGGIGASVYGLYCDETAATFVVLWYTAGIAAAAGLGAIAGRWLLRW
jgi:hypothetical protein